MTEEPTGGDEWATMALVLAGQPITVATIIAAHVGNLDGMCAGCTSGGTGATRSRWPCAVRRIAERAQTIHLARQT